MLDKDHIFPAIPPNDTIDQYGFKPTGNTIAELVDLTSRIYIMIEDNKYVDWLLMDFTKAFDSVDHLILIVRRKKLKISDNIIQWLI